MKRGGRRIAVDGRHDVGAERFADRRLVLERVAIGLPDQIAGDVGVVEPLADAMDDRAFQRVVMQDVLIDEGRELRLAARDLLGLAGGCAPRPDRPCRDLWQAASEIEPWTSSPGASRRHSPSWAVSITNRQPSRGRQCGARMAPACHSGTLVKEFQHAGLEDLVADRQHVIAARDIEQRLRARESAPPVPAASPPRRPWCRPPPAPAR